MGYQPDPMLSALSSYRLSRQEKPVQAALAWLTFWKNPKELHTLQEFDLYWQGATERANQLGFRLDEFAVGKVTPERLDGMLKARGIQGILLAPYRPAMDDALMRFPFKDYATVRFGRSTDKPYADSITSDQISNAELAFEQMLARGYQRIGLVGSLSATRPYGAGFFWAQELHATLEKIPELNFSEGESMGPKQLERFAAWFKKEQPEAILTDKPELYDWLIKLDYRIPEDIALATLTIHDTPINAGIDQNPMQIGRMATQLLTSHLYAMTKGLPELPCQTLVPGTWIDGDMLPERTGRSLIKRT